MVYSARKIIPRQNSKSMFEGLQKTMTVNLEAKKLSELIKTNMANQLSQPKDSSINLVDKLA